MFPYDELNALIVFKVVEIWQFKKNQTEWGIWGIWWGIWA